MSFTNVNATQLTNRMPQLSSLEQLKASMPNVTMPDMSALNTLPDPIKLVTGLSGGLAAFSALYIRNMDDVYLLIFVSALLGLWIHFWIEYMKYTEPSPNAATPSRSTTPTSSTLLKLVREAGGNESDDVELRKIEANENMLAHIRARALPGCFDQSEEEFMKWYPMHPFAAHERVFFKEMKDGIMERWNGLLGRLCTSDDAEQVGTSTPSLQLAMKEQARKACAPFVKGMDKGIQAWNWLSRDVPQPIPTRKIPGLFPTAPTSTTSPTPVVESTGFEWDASGNWPDPGRVYLDFDILDSVTAGFQTFLRVCILNTWTPWGYVLDKVHWNEVGFWYWDPPNMRELAMQASKTLNEELDQFREDEIDDGL